MWDFMVGLVMERILAGKSHLVQGGLRTRNLGLI